MRKTSFLLLLVLIFSGCKDVIFDNPLDPNLSKLKVKIVKIMNTSISGNGDFCFDGEKLWFSSEDGNVYAIDPSSGIVLKEIPIGGTPTGITYFNGLLYVSLGNESDIVIVDPLSGGIINEMPMGERLPLLISNDGENLIIYDSRTQSLYYFNEENDQFTFLFKLTGFKPSGIEYDSGNIVLVERTNLSVYIFTLSGDIIKTYASPTNYPGGITKDQEGNYYLFSTDGKIYKLQLN